jgi:hypothetical protein
MNLRINKISTQNIKQWRSRLTEQQARMMPKLLSAKAIKTPLKALPKDQDISAHPGTLSI